jgi:hypothetical protein
MPHASGRSPVNRILDARLLQWLGTRALGLYLLHGPVLLTVERVCELRGLDRASTPVAYGVLAAVVLGSLITAELGYRVLESRLAASAVAPVAISMYRRPHSRPERISRIDQNAIPEELRLRPLPRKATADAPVTETPIETPIDAPAKRAKMRPIDVAASQSDGKPLPVKAVRKPAEKAAEVPAEAAANRPTRKSVRKPAAKSVELPPITPARSIELPAAELAATSIELPADKPETTSVELPADKPTRKTVARKPVAKAADKPIDLDRPTGKPGSDDQVLDADAKNLDADAQP